MKSIRPTHLYRIQAACGSLGTSLDIKFSLNSQRIVQLCLSNYQWFVMGGVRGKRLEKGHEVQSQRCSGPRGTQGDPEGPRGTQVSGSTGNQSTGQSCRGLCVDSYFAQPFSLLLSNNTVRVHTHSAPFSQESQQGKPGKRRDFLCFWIKKQRHEEEDHGCNV